MTNDEIEAVRAELEGCLEPESPQDWTCARALAAIDHLTKRVGESENLLAHYKRERAAWRISDDKPLFDQLAAAQAEVARLEPYVEGFRREERRADDLAQREEEARAQLAARDAAIAAVADAMLQGGDGQTGDYGWNITKLNKARPLIRQIKQPEPDKLVEAKEAWRIASTCVTEAQFLDRLAARGGRVVFDGEGV